MHIIEPSFDVDNKGRVICRAHTNYKSFLKPKDYFEDMSMEEELTCLTCGHYIDNDCYISKSKFDDIIKNNKKYICILCGERIHRPFSIIHQIFLKEAYDVDIPLICCNCYDFLNYDTFMRVSMNKIYFALLIFFFGIFFSMVFLFLLDIFAIITILVFLWIIPWSLFTINRLKKLRKVIHGINYYKKNFIQNSEIN